MNKPIPNSIAALVPEMTAWRRDFHENPELGYEETRTAAIVAEKLKEFGFDHIETGIGKTGVVGVLHGADGPAEREEDRILLRADMDALPMDETSGLPHASKVAGKMHACGHDGHTAMLLGAAKHLSETRNFKGSVVFCFQPAEECGAGAEAMLKDGMLERHPVRAVYGLHTDPQLPVGEFSITTGAVMAYADEWRITVQGKGGHAAHPNYTNDPIICASKILDAFQTIVSRRTDPMKPLVISTTIFQGGSAPNVIPDIVELGGTVRTFDNDVAKATIADMTKQAEMIAAAYGCRVDCRMGMDAYPACINDAKESQFVGDVIEELYGADKVDREFPPTLGGEDFSYLALERPGAFVFIGNGLDSAPVHHPDFDFNDESAPLGVTYWAKLVETALPRK